MAKKSSSRLKAQAELKVPYNLPEPNDDCAAYGWHMNRLRYPTTGTDKNDIWPGPSIFDVEEAREYRKEYGFDVQFACPAYLQFMLDHSRLMQQAVYLAAKNKYSAASVKKIEAAVKKSISEILIPDIETRLHAVAGYIAGYYAAKMAYIETYGAADADPD